jgi:hypothetical protein
VDDGAENVSEGSLARGMRLLSLSRERQWDVEEALPWDALELHLVSPPIRRAMAAVYASTLHAESLAFTLIDRLVDLAPEGLLRDFARAQRTDEARHVQFFSRVVAGLSRDEHPTTLGPLEKELAGVRDSDEIMVHAQVVETAGQVLFAGTTKRAAALMRPGMKLPGSASVAAVLACIHERVASDEARHVAFASFYLENRVRELDAPRLRGLMDRAAISADLTCDAFAALAPAYSRLGIDVNELLSLIRRRIDAQLARLGAIAAEDRAFGPPGATACT